MSRWRAVGISTLRSEECWWGRWIGCNRLDGRPRFTFKGVVESLALQASERQSKHTSG